MRRCLGERRGEGLRGVMERFGRGGMASGIRSVGRRGGRANMIVVVADCGRE